MINIITEFIFDVLLFLPKLLLNALDTSSLTFTIPDIFYSGLSMLLNGVGYFFPVVAIAPILITKFAFKTVRIAWALIVRIKSFIPTMGS